MTSPKLIIFTKDKSYDTWIPLLLSLLERFSIRTNSKGLQALLDPYVKVDKDLNIKFVFFSHGVQKRLIINFDVDNSISNRYGYDVICLELNLPISTTESELVYLKSNLDFMYETIIEECSYASTN